MTSGLLPAWQLVRVQIVIMFKGLMAHMYLKIQLAKDVGGTVLQKGAGQHAME